jgi:hypothetical protein
MNTPSELDCLGSDSCVCPYCGHEDNASDELVGDSGITECGACSRPYHYERVISVDYSTVPIMGPHHQDELQQKWELEHEEDRKQ